MKILGRVERNPIAFPIVCVPPTSSSFTSTHAATLSRARMRVILTLSAAKELRNDRENTLEADCRHVVHIQPHSSLPLSPPVAAEADGWTGVREGGGGARARGGTWWDCNEVEDKNQKRERESEGERVREREWERERERESQRERVREGEGGREREREREREGEGGREREREREREGGREREREREAGFRMQDRFSTAQPVGAAAPRTPLDRLAMLRGVFGVRNDGDSSLHLQHNRLIHGGRERGRGGWEQKKKKRERETEAPELIAQ